MTKQEQEALKQKVEISEQLIEEKTAENEELKSRLNAIEEKIGLSKGKTKEEAKKPTVPEPFQFKEDVVKFQYAAFRFEGKKYIASKETTNEELLSKLLKLDSPLLKKVTK